MDADLSLRSAIEEMVRAGHSGPWVIGLAACSLCGFTFRVVVPVCPKHHPLDEWLACDNCERVEARLVNVNGDVHAG